MNEEVANRSLVGGRRIAAAFTMLFFSAQTIFISAFWVLILPYEWFRYGAVAPITLLDMWEGTMRAFVAMSIPVFSYSLVMTGYLASAPPPYRLKAFLVRALVVTVIFYGLSAAWWLRPEQEDLWILALILLSAALAAAAGSAWIVHRYLKMLERSDS